MVKSAALRQAVIGLLVLVAGCSAPPANPNPPNPPAQPPASVADAYDLDEGATLEIDAAAGVLANDTTSSGTNLSAALKNPPLHGTLTLAANGGFSYQHDGSETTSDRFFYVASDGSLEGSLTSVTLTVTPVNDAPEAQGLELTTRHDASVDIQLRAHDNDDDTLEYRIVTPPQHGRIDTFDSASGSAVYTPEKGFTGQDRFTYRVIDAASASDDKEVIVIVLEPAADGDKILAVSVSGQGTVASDPAGIDCPPSCSKPFSDGATVTLTATPAVGYAFEGWDGACRGTEACTLAMSADRNVTAVFRQQETSFPLTVAVDGKGRVTSADGAIDCTLTCTVEMSAAGDVLLTAGPDDGNRFVGWEGDCSGSDTSCALTMDAGKSVSARFAEANKPSAWFYTDPYFSDYYFHTAPIVVSFDASDSEDADGRIVEYAWDFGDGKSGSGKEVKHTYDASGTYTVWLTVTDNDGLTAKIKRELNVGAAYGHQVARERGETVGKDDRYGSAVAIHGGDAVVGAPGNDSDPGAGAFFLQQNGDSWDEVSSLKASEVAATRLGHDVAISYYLAAATYSDQTDCAASRSGCSGVVILRRSWPGWTYFTRLDFASTDDVHDIAVVDDWVLILGNNRVRLYKRNYYYYPYYSYRLDSMGTLSPESGESFGNHLDVDDDRLLVSGSEAHLFKLTGNSWSLSHTFTEPALDVAISGDRAVLVSDTDGDGDETLRIHRLEGGVWVFEQEIAYEIGDEDEARDIGPIDLSGDHMAVGMPGNDDRGSDTGAVLIYKRQNKTWKLVNTIYPNERENNADFNFGTALSLSGDNAVVGAPQAEWVGKGETDEGAAYFFKHGAP